MDVDVIAIGVEGVVEDEGRVHEAARVDQAAPLTNLHLLNVKYEAAVENMES